MQDISVRRSAIVIGPQSHGQASHRSTGWHDTGVDQPSDHQFVAMLDGYRASGGLAASPELLALCRRHGGTDVATLARWIVERTVVSFEWQSRTWFPLFQFRAPDFAPTLRLRPLLADLSAIYCPWEVAHWFIIPNLSLGSRVPMGLLDSDLDAVLRAARGMTTPPGKTAPGPVAIRNGLDRAPNRKAWALAAHGPS